MYEYVSLGREGRKESVMLDWTNRQPEVGSESILGWEDFGETLPNWQQGYRSRFLTELRTASKMGNNRISLEIWSDSAEVDLFLFKS
jgi:hypothetical protein